MKIFYFILNEIVNLKAALLEINFLLVFLNKQNKSLKKKLRITQVFGHSGQFFDSNNGKSVKYLAEKKLIFLLRSSILTLSILILQDCHTFMILRIF